MSVHGPTAAQLDKVLERLSGHLDDLAEEVSSIEHAICDELAKTVSQRSGNIQRLQRLDFMRQSLEDAALLTLFLSRNSKGLVDAGLAVKLRLESTQKLLTGSAVPCPDTLPGPLGEVDLF